MVTLVASSESNSSNTNRNYRIYINGEEVTSNTSPNDYNYKFSNNSDQRLFLGSEIGGQNNFFKGKLDDIRIYSGALSADQIKVLYDKESEGSDLSTIIVPAGSTSGVKYVYPKDDTEMAESDETLSIGIDTLSIDTIRFGSTLTSASSVDITIKDNDIKPTVGISLTNSTVKEGSSDYATLKATLDQVTTVDVEVYVDETGDADLSLGQQFPFVPLTIDL